MGFGKFVLFYAWNLGRCDENAPTLFKLAFRIHNVKLKWTQEAVFVKNFVFAYGIARADVSAAVIFAEIHFYWIKNKQKLPQKGAQN